jgi:putative membrane protein insertion efficiency factor
MPGAGRLVNAMLARPLVWLVMAYQLLISPLLGPTCKFYPSCSSYAITALTEHGPLRGLWLAGRRLLRCHPWSHGGVDHVPPRREAATPTTGELRSPRD